MSEDVTTTAKADAQEPKGTGESLQIDIPDWVKDPVQAFAAIQKLQEKSQKRLSELSEFEQRVQAIELERKKAEEAKLAEEKRWQELAENRQAEIDALKNQIESEKTEARRQKLENAILAAAAAANFIDPAEAALLIDRGTIQASDDTDSIKKAVEALAKAKPHLLKDTRQARGNAAPAPAGTTTEPDLSWLPGYRAGKARNPFGDGGVIPPQGN